MFKSLKFQVIAVAYVVLLSACSVRTQTGGTPRSNQSMANSGKAWASLWQQRAAEYKALCFQAYNSARLQVNEAINTPTTKPLAIVTDIDETVLDNSPYDAQCALNNLEYDTGTWKQWTAKAIADTVAGAPSFLKYAASKGISVFYITNRDEDERAATLKNLQRYGLPDADDQHLLLRQSSSSKESRRQQVLKTHNIIMLCGDNLADFDALYDNKPNEQNRDAATRRLTNQFGTRYIVLPNPSYGDWEGALYQFNYKLSPMQKDSLIRAITKVSQ